MESTQNVPVGIYYIVFADLVGSTKFAVEMGNDAFRFRIETFVQASKRAFDNAKRTSNTGRFLKTAGDGVLFVFSHFPDVVRWDMEFDGLLGLAEIGTKPYVRRVFVHAGEVRFKADDALVLAVSQMFKTEKKAKAGELVLTDIAHKLALPSIDPKHGFFKEYRKVAIDGYSHPVKLRRLVVKSDMAFVINKTD